MINYFKTSSYVKALISLTYLTKLIFKYHKVSKHMVMSEVNNLLLLSVFPFSPALLS